MFESLLIAKILVSVAAVVGLSLVAEHVSPRVAGVLSGYPLGTAIALFFIGVENGSGFAATAARHTLLGFAASLVLVYGYFLASRRIAPVEARGGPRYAALAGGSVLGIGAFLATSAMLSPWQLPLWANLALPALAIVLAIRLFRRIPNTRIEQRVRFTQGVLLVRASISAAIVLLITGVADAVGPGWAGLLSAFPITLFPFLVIMHLSYGAAPVYTIIKNYPFGLGSLLVYALSVSYSYPALGVAWGTLAAFAAATAYLLLFMLWSNRRHAA